MWLLSILTVISNMFLQCSRCEHLLMTKQRLLGPILYVSSYMFSVCIGYCFLFPTNNDAAHLSVILALTVISLFSPEIRKPFGIPFLNTGSLFTNPAAQSPQWYSWGPPNMQCRLCASCWNYWKKYGGLKTPTQLEGAARAASVSLIFSLVSLAIEKSFIGRASKYPPLRMSFTHCPGVRSTWSYDTPRGSRDVAIYPQ